MQIIPVILAILALSLFFNQRFRFTAAAAPMFSIALVTVFLCFAGMLDLLFWGCCLVYLSAAAALAYVIFVLRRPFKTLVSEFLTPGLVFFVSASLFFMYMLTVKNAIFRDWDEFSFWGTAAKLVFMNDRLYTFFPASVPLSTPPALPLFSYFVQFFGRAFVERYTYLAYDMMIAAALAVMFSRVKWKNVIPALVLTAFGLLGVYAFFRSSSGIRAYATAYSDAQMGFLFGGALLMWFSRESKGFIRYFASLTMLALLTLCKDMGFAFALIAGGIMAFDMILSKNYPSDAFGSGGKSVLKFSPAALLALIGVFLFAAFSQTAGIVFFVLSAAAAAVAVFAKTAAPNGKTEKYAAFLWRVFFVLLFFVLAVFLYRLWAAHYASAVGSSRDPGFKISFLEILRGESEYFNMVFADMKQRFFGDSLICFGTIFEMTLVFTAVPIAAALTAKSKRNALRIACFSVLCALGFLAYYLFHAYLYVAIFPNLLELGLPYELASFNRYISSYAIGWMFAAAGALFLEAAEPRFKKPFLSFVPSAAAASLLIFSLFYHTPDHPDQYLLTSSKVLISESGPRTPMIRHIRKLRSGFSSGDKVYFVSFALDGGEWFYFNYEVYPALIDKELGWFVRPGTEDPAYRDAETGEMARGFVEMDRKGFSDYLREAGVDFVYVNYRIDEYFLEEFAPLFEDNLMLTFDDSARFYYVKDTGVETVTLVPVFSAEQLKTVRGA